MDTSIRKIRFSLALLPLLALVAMPVMASAITYNPPITINNPTPNYGDAFGYAVSIDGNKFVVGEISDDTGADGAGSAHLYDATTGALLQTFNNPMPAVNDHFGFSVSLSGDKVLISAPHDDTGALNAGSAYLYDATTGALLQTFNNPTPAVDDHFGSYFSMSDDKIVIGAPSHDTGATNAGSAYLYDAITGALLHTFNSPTPISGGAFGSSVSISGDNVLISAPNGEAITAPTGSTYRIGSAYLFNATTGVLLQTFENPILANGSIVPGSGIQTLAVSGDKVVISYLVNLSGHSSYGFGRVYLFDITTGTVIRGFSNPAATFFDYFGTSVSISGDKVLIGASFKNIGTINAAGSAYLYDIATGALLNTFNNPTPVTGESFGSSVSLSGSKVLIGAPGDYVGSFPAGRVYLYSPLPDADGEGIIESVDNCSTVANANQADTDGDRLGNACDPTPNGDTDGDSVDNLADNCPTVANPGQEDTDSDGIGNICDPTPNGDNDGDGVDNLADNCPNVANAGQEDNDVDGLGNACDSTPNGDADNDGIDNLADNCPLVANANQADADNDGVGDACDPVANAGADQTVIVGGSITLDGSASYHPSAGTLTYSWNFGDSATGSGSVVSHTYATSGVYTATLTITDNNGATGIDTVQVTIQTPAEATDDLVDLVETFNLQQGISNSLDTKLDAALEALNDVNVNNNQAAINSLQAFINAVEAQRGNKITNEQADTLIAEAQAIISSLSL